MNEYVITPLSDLNGIANNIRNKTNATEKFQISELQNQIDNVYEVGQNSGQNSEQKRFWEVFQNGGRRTEYRNAFYSWLWKDSIYNPIYPIVCKSNSSEMFRHNTSITDTKVDIDFSGITTSQSQYVFANTSALKTIGGDPTKSNSPKLIVNENVTFTGWFGSCTGLENINFGGVIGQNIDFSACTLLTYASLMNIIEHLKDFSGTTTTRTLSIGSANLAKISDSEKAIATGKGWSVA